MVQVSLSTSTNFDGNINALVEDQGTELTVRFDLDEPAPAGGLRVFVDGNVEQIVNRLDLPTFTFNPVTENINPASFGTDFDNTGFVVTIDEGATFGSFTIPIFDNAEPDTFLPATFDGLVAATFSLVAAEDVSEEDASNITDISEYDISGNNASSIVFFADDASQLPDIPVVSFSTTPDVISESEGTALVLNFTVDGDIPEGGITVNLEGDTPEILQQFLAPDGDGAVQTRVTNEGNILYRFDTSFEPDNSNFGNIVGGSLNVFALEDGDPSETNSNPEAAGDGFLSNFSFTITEATASITLPVLDDVVQEDDVTFTYTLAPGAGYEINPDADSGTFTVTDGVEFPDTPVVGVAATPTTLVESEQTVLTLTFTTEGDIPAEGLVVLLEGAPRSIAEFDVNASNPRDPEDTITLDGPVATGGNIVGTDEVAGALFFRITEPTATLSVEVFDDDVAEGEEILDFELIDGEAYSVDPGASSLSLTINDGDGSGLDLLDTPFTRFQNSSIPGTYVYATGDEVDSIRANQPGFVEEGVAFSAAIAPDDDLIAFSRLESNQLPGTFLYVGDEELASINADPNFSNAFTNQGVAFYVYGAGAGEETPFNRFQNSGVPGTYVYATGAEADSIRANFPGFIDEGVAFEAAI